MTAPRAVTVVGAGVAGLASALELARAGFSVAVVGGGSASASEAAAGMIAPASEALLDGSTAETAAALRRARELWDAWADRLGLVLDRSGALHLGPPDELSRRARDAQALGFTVARTAEGALHLPEDAVLDPKRALQALRRVLAEAQVAVHTGAVESLDGRLTWRGAPLPGEVVIAAGWGSAALAGAAPELAALHPIKGQLLRVAGPAGRGPTVRAPGVYIAPQPDGWTVGATMEPGRSDLEADPEALEALREAAVAVAPGLAGAPWRAVVGVRAAAPDGLPLVGRSRAGPWLATGLRRNGWLLAPLVAEGLAAYLEGSDPDAALARQARAWRPGRVLPPEQGPA